jgi:hypothetical protein
LPLIRPGIGGPVTVFVNVYYHRRTVYTYMGLIMSIVVIAPVTIPVTVVGIVMVMPVVVVPIIIVPVVGSPGSPVRWVVSPVPG